MDRYRRERGPRKRDRGRGQDCVRRQDDHAQLRRL